MADEETHDDDGRRRRRVAGDADGPRTSSTRTASGTSWPTTATPTRTRPARPRIDRGPTTSPAPARQPRRRRSSCGSSGLSESGYGAPVLHGVGLGDPPGRDRRPARAERCRQDHDGHEHLRGAAAWAGTIEFDGGTSRRWATRKGVGKGIVMVPEGRRVFPDLSVARNLQVGAWTQQDDDGWFEQQRDQVFDYFPRLRERERSSPGRCPAVSSRCWRSGAV